MPAFCDGGLLGTVGALYVTCNVCLHGTTYQSEAQFNIAYTGFTLPTVSHELSVVVFMVPIQLTQYSVNMAPFQLPHCYFVSVVPVQLTYFSISVVPVQNIHN